MASKGSLVLVSGASGFLASHCVKQLLEAGYKVRGTVRSTTNESKVKPLRDICAKVGCGADRLELVEADLLKADTWLNAVKGCDYVLHVASPFPATSPRDENELIKPAVDGTLNVLKACAAVDTVKRVVLTSSVAAIAYGYGKERGTKVFDENDWTKIETPGINTYVKSKFLAEKAAWDYVKEHPKLELSVINPTFIVGPMLNDTECTSSLLLTRMMKRDMPMIPHLKFGFVDVRDVAKAHIQAMTRPEAKDQRFILTGDTHWWKEMNTVLLKEFGSQGYNPSTTEAPYAALWLVSWFDKSVALLLAEVDQDLKLDNKKMREVLKINPPIPMEKSVVDMAYSLIAKGLIPKSPKLKTDPETRDYS